MKGLLFIAIALALVALPIPGANAQGIPEENSAFCYSVSIEEYPRVTTVSDGDLWPSCWAEDDNLYAANGDGWGFTSTTGFFDIAVNRIHGRPPALTGVRLAQGDQVGSIWTPGGQYNRKPTGMLALDGALYLAIQDLALDFDDAPAASISMSTDGGYTWTWDKSGPMFRDHVFTTIMFLDFGKNARYSPREYVYAYGLDNNWRESVNNRVPDPQALYLARIPKDGIMQRSRWRFFAGLDGSGQPIWSEDIGARRPVLEDTRRVYTNPLTSSGRQNMSVISQGSIVYNAPLKRYLYTSWTGYTYEFYEAPQPWGPWRLFFHKDFGVSPWTTYKFGGYGTTIPSKFISGDGRTMYVQDNTFLSGVVNYKFALRKMTLEPWAPRAGCNAANPTDNIARTAAAVPIAKSFRLGAPRYLRDGIKSHSEDDRDGEQKPLSWWGYTWNQPYRISKLVYTTGLMMTDGGWFRETPRVQVRQDFVWHDVPNVVVSPAYPGNATAGSNRSYTFTFDDVVGSGIRIIGAPGGSAAFTSIAELEAYYSG